VRGERALGPRPSRPAGAICRTRSSPRPPRHPRCPAEIVPGLCRLLCSSAWRHL